MSPTAVPTRITIDFRDAVHPSRTWILGLDTEPKRRVDLITFDGPSRRVETRAAPMPRTAMPLRAHIAALAAECECPEFCERDHANE